MQQTGEYRIGAPRIAVWAALNDPEVLARCIDGCQSMVRMGDNQFEARVKARIGPVSATFSANLTLSDLNEPESYTLIAAVKGGAAGFGKGVAHVNLSAEGDDTVLRYTVEGSVGGKLAQVGQRLVDAAARKMADDFFSRFGEEVAPGAVAPGASEQAVAANAGTESSGRYVIWIIVFLVLGLAIILAS